MFKELKPKNDEEWLALRAKVLTATDIGVILGLNKWKSVKELIEGKKKFEPFENSYIWLGQVLEPVVVSATNKVLGSNFKLFENGSRSFFADEELKLGATPDAGEGDMLLECKSTKPGNFLRWQDWPPAYYLAQLYTQLICTDRNSGYLAIMSTDLSQKNEILNLPIHIHKLTRTEKLDNILIEEVKRFWKACEDGKLYRVNRKAAVEIELLFRFATKRVF
jgi:predicted phage-related endonuclease